MHVPWGWIKQRPHFFAEGLSENFHVTVVYRDLFRSGFKLYNKINCNLEVIKFLYLPFIRITVIHLISNSLFSVFLKWPLLKSKIIWVTSPSIFHQNLLKTEKILVYDAMDDILEFPDIKVNQIYKEEIINKERKLYLHAKVVITSSKYLKSKLIERYGERPIHVINNAVIPACDILDNLTLPSELGSYFNGSKRKKLVYIGTISDWLDFELIISILNRFNMLDIVLVGPCQTKIPVHQSLKVFKAVDHRYIFSIMKFSDGLFMPFVLSELIRSVNPVKLYEYIYSGKPCIAVSYDETLSFKDFVHLYESKKQMFLLVEKLLSGELNSNKSRIDIEEFCESNTWPKRNKQILDILKEYL
jgi:hypothetical protein